jgi:hypothetical protein
VMAADRVIRWTNAGPSSALHRSLRFGSGLLQQAVRLPGGSFQAMPRFIADYLTGFLRGRPYPRWAEPGMRPRARPAGYPRLRVGGARLAKLLREEQ